MAGTAANLSDLDLTAWCGGYPAQGLEMLGRVAVPLMMLALGMSLAGAPGPCGVPSRTRLSEARAGVAACGWPWAGSSLSCQGWPSSSGWRRDSAEHSC